MKRQDAKEDQNSTVHRNSLRKFYHWGVKAEVLGQPDRAVQLYQQGIAQAEQFLRAGEIDNEVWTQALGLYFNAGDFAHDQGQLDRAAQLYQQGIDKIEQLLSAGENDSEVWALLALYFFAGGLANAKGQPDRAHHYQQGIDKVEQFLRAGETARKVRIRMLRLYINAGDLAHDQDQLEQAAQLYQQGIVQVEQFLRAGETASEVRAQALWMFFKAGVISDAQGQPDRAAQLFQQGIDEAEQFLREGETASEVCKLVLGLYVNAGLLARDQGQPDRAAQFFQQGIDKVEQFLSAGEPDSEVRYNALGLYFNIGLLAKNQGLTEQAEQYYLQGIGLAEKFLAADEADGRVKEGTLILYVNAGNDNRRLGQLTQAEQYLQKGLRWAKEFLAAGDSSGVLYECTLRLYINLANLAKDKGQLTQSEQYSQQGMSWAEKFMSVGESHSMVKSYAVTLCYNCFFYAFNRRQGTESNQFSFLWRLLQIGQSFSEKKIPILYRSNYTTLAYNWHAALEQWLTGFFHPEAINVKPSELRIIVQASEALLWRNAALSMRDFKVRENARQQLDQLLEKQLISYQNEYANLVQRLTKYSKRLPAPLLDLSLSKLGLMNPKAIGAKLSRYQRLAYAWKLYRLTRLLERYQHHQDQSPRPDSNDWQKIEIVQKKHSVWLAGRWLQIADAGTELSDPGAVLLGILLAASTEQPVVTLTSWLTNPPWQQAKELTTLMESSHCREWYYWFSGEENTVPTLYGWVSRLPQYQKLHIDSHILNQRNRPLEDWVARYAERDTEKMRTALQYSWSNAIKEAWKLQHMSRVLSNAQLEDTPEIVFRKLIATSMRIQSASESEEEVIEPEALAAVILGDGVDYLQQAIHAWMERLWPLDSQADCAQVRAVLDSRFSALLALYPGPEQHAALSERLHAWSQNQLSFILAESEPDYTELWRLLERGRFALTGARLGGKDINWDDWDQQLGKELYVLCSKQSMYQASSLSPLDHWLKSMEKHLPQCPMPRTCQQRLQTGEALVQLFFDPNTGQLHALWLTAQQPLVYRRFPESCRQAVWSNADQISGVIDRWQDSYLRPSSERQVGFNEMLESSAVKAFCQILVEWAQAAKVHRLVLLLPAELHQLPWEAHESFRLARITLERAVSLRAWRQSSWAPPEQTGTVRYPPQDKSLHYAPHEAASIRSFWSEPETLPLASQQSHKLKITDVISCLQGNAHLIMHGNYQAYDPRLSYLKIDDWTRLPVWVFSALNVQGHIGLSVCESALAKPSAEPLLSSVGIGPSLVAAGAKRVSGSLWPCDQLVSFLVHRFLYEHKSKAPELRWSAALHKAKQQLRVLTFYELETLLESLLGKDYNPWDLEHLNRPTPFADPFYWAAFVLLGEDG